jgi:hypothetical protein
MRGPSKLGRIEKLLLLVAGSCLIVEGCQALNDHLSRWHMLGSEEMENPIQAVGGDGVVFSPHGDDKPLGRKQLAAAGPQELVAYYAPVFVQQRINTTAQRHPYPPEYDEIGEARMRRDKEVELKAFIAGPPKVYAIYETHNLGGHDHGQLTYTAWYPAHPRMKLIDLEEADIDSCVVRITLDGDHAPVCYETIAACGCFHKIFIQRWIEDAAARTYGAAEKGKKYVVEKTLKTSLAWEVAGLVDERHDQPHRPVVFIKAGDHKVIGLGSTARMRVPQSADVRPYELAEYSELYTLPVEGSADKAPFFDLKQGGKVYGAQRKERFIFSLIGVDDAGHPRANDQIKMHFDQSVWSDPTIYERFLRLPPGVL